MTKVWQFPDGQYYVSSSTGIYESNFSSNQRTTCDIEKTKKDASQGAFLEMNCRKVLIDEYLSTDSSLH